ncbi:hypothetical protein CHARACLAT_032414 [Characodon lateralis]|uniref:Uncharacterized protein n=1 Tax=Characodon lateralis TaxID=208331 RepID=A0ABU7D5C0_9TELE|nr:hypothetical protein [Characodon lateralis]
MKKRWKSGNPSQEWPPYQFYSKVALMTHSGDKSSQKTSKAQQTTLASVKLRVSRQKTTAELKNTMVHLTFAKKQKYSVGCLRRSGNFCKPRVSFWHKTHTAFQKKKFILTSKHGSISVMVCGY